MSIYLIYRPDDNRRYVTEIFFVNQKFLSGSKDGRRTGSSEDFYNGFLVINKVSSRYLVNFRATSWIYCIIFSILGLFLLFFVFLCTDLPVFFC